MQWVKAPVAALMCLSLLCPPLPGRIAGNRCNRHPGPTACTAPPALSVRPDSRRYTHSACPRPLHLRSQAWRRRSRPCYRSRNLVRATASPRRPRPLRPERPAGAVPCHAVERGRPALSAPQQRRHSPGNERQGSRSRTGGILKPSTKTSLIDVSAKREAQAQKKEAALNSQATAAGNSSGAGASVDDSASKSMSSAPNITHPCNRTRASTPVDESLFGTLLVLPPQQRVAKLASLPQPEFDSFFKSLRGGQRERLVSRSSAR